MKTRGNVVSVRSIAGVQPSSRVALAGLVLIALSGAFAKEVQADLIGDLITVIASNEQGSTIAHVPVPLSDGLLQGNDPDHVLWMLEERFDLESDGGVLIGSIESMMVELIGDPIAGISFTATAGSADTTFSLSSATISFPALTNPPALSDAELTLTDTDSNGASVSVVSPNSGLFRSVYNGSSEFSELLGSISIGGGSTSVMGDTSGAISGSVSSIQAVWTFKLSANDQTSGSGTFEVVIPEPSTLLLALCILSTVGVRIRKRRA